MNRHTFFKSCVYTFLSLAISSAYSGSLTTSGQGSRALSMGGAFTAVADDGSAIYYNPAGISQIAGSEIMLGTAHGRPDITYKTPSGAKEKSTKDWLGLWLFATHHFNDQLSGGIGIYSPYARDAEFSADLANFFAAQKSTIYRLDISPVLSFKVNPHYSVAGGLVLGYSEANLSLPSGPTSRIKDSMTGWGLGGIVSVLISTNDKYKLGLTYRSRMKTEYSGYRQLQTLATVTKSDATATEKWPASAGLGVCWLASSKLKLSLDADWTQWSYVDKVITKTDTLGNSTTILDQRNTWDFRIGGEWRIRPSWYLRAGFSHILHSTPSTRIIPSQADTDGTGYDFGVGKKWKDWSIDFAYEYATTDTVKATDNAYGFTGNYQIQQQIIALTASYHYRSPTKY
jgi:long-chain fatty acid transport protein